VFSSIGTLNVCIENESWPIAGAQYLQIDMFTPFADDSIELKESWDGSTGCVNFENLIRGKGEKIREWRRASMSQNEAISFPRDLSMLLSFRCRISHLMVN
jgi:hypothetical protein